MIRCTNIIAPLTSRRLSRTMCVGWLGASFDRTAVAAGEVCCWMQPCNTSIRRCILVSVDPKD